MKLNLYIQKRNTLQEKRKLYEEKEIYSVGTSKSTCNALEDKAFDRTR